eukprot:7848146-Lingulodinium_polyedra.AAC.1
MLQNLDPKTWASAPGEPLGEGLSANGQNPRAALVCAGQQIQPPLICEPLSRDAIMNGPLELAPT